MPTQPTLVHLWGILAQLVPILSILARYLPMSPKTSSQASLTPQTQRALVYLPLLVPSDCDSVTITIVEVRQKRQEPR